MPTSLPSLDQARQEIDRLDDAMHDLLMRRAALVGQIRAAKPAGMSMLRPGRESIILRRLLSRHDASYPASALVRLWREMMGSFAAMQGDVTIAVPAGLQHLARGHFGGAFSYRSVPHESAALDLLTEETVSAAVMPWPTDEADWWWRLRSVRDAPRVVAAVPFLGNGDPEALLLAYVEVEETGEDRTLMTVPFEQELSFPHRLIAAQEGHRLIESPVFLSEKTISAVPDAVRLGVYAVPFQTEDPR